jgi:hypothetical protein
MRFNRSLLRTLQRLTMNSALFSPAPVRAQKRFWLATAGWFIACVASVTLAAASVPQTGWAANVVQPASVAHLLPAAATPAAVAAVKAGGRGRFNGRCQSCGVVELVRVLQVAGTAPAGYELTVRLRDGSRRVSNHSASTGWRVGDQIMVLGGASI